MIFNRYFETLDNKQVSFNDVSTTIYSELSKTRILIRSSYCYSKVLTLRPFRRLVVETQ